METWRSSKRVCGASAVASIARPACPVEPSRSIEPCVFSDRVCSGGGDHCLKTCIAEKPPRTTLVVRGGVRASSDESVDAIVATVRVGFEPTVTRRPRRFSRPVRSTAPPPHLVTAARTGRGGHGTPVPRDS